MKLLGPLKAKSNGVHLSAGNRYDSLTGVPSAQRTVAFEKACVLFNLGALHTQIGTREERGTEEGLDNAVDNFLRAAAVFRFIVDNFTNAPSMDLAPQVLDAFILLMIVNIPLPVPSDRRSASV